MSDVAGVITAVAALVAAVGGVVAAIIGYLNRQKVTAAAEKAALAATAAEQSAREIVATREGIFTLGERIDGQLEKLLAGARAEGVAAGEQAQRDRTAEAQTPPDLR